MLLFLPIRCIGSKDRARDLAMKSLHGRNKINVYTSFAIPTTPTETDDLHTLLARPSAVRASGNVCMQPTLR